MGLLSKVGQFFGEVTGFGGNGNPNPHNTDPSAFSEFYDKAIGDIKAVGTGGNMAKMRGGIEETALSQLAELENNAEGRKTNFMEDMSRAFNADAQNLARSKGGTGGLAGSLRMNGGMYDSQARETSRGLNDLYSQATDDLGALTGIQGNLYGQDMEKAQTGADINMKEMMSRRGQLNANNENTFNSEQAGRERRMNTLSGIVKGGGQIFGAGK